MNLLEELLGYRLHERKGVYGRKSVRVEARIESERRAAEVRALAAAEKAGEKMATAPHLVLAVLRDGRARFEGDICEVTCLSSATVVNVLHRLRRKGVVEQICVGTFKLWAATCKS